MHDVFCCQIKFNNCSQMKFVAIILVLLAFIFNAIFGTIEFLSDGVISSDHLTLRGGRRDRLVKPRGLRS